MDGMNWFRSHVERCLQDVWKVPQAVADEDGDYPFRCGRAAGYVGITAGEVPTFVRVWALAAVDVKKSAKLLAELNQINANTLTVRFYWLGGSILAEQMLIAEAVSVDSLYQACDAVGSMADYYGVLFAGGFDGRTPYDSSAELDEASSES